VGLVRIANINRKKNKMTNNKNTLLIVLIVVVVLILFGGFGLGGYNMISGYNNGFTLFNWVFNLLILVLVIVGIYWLVKNINFNERRR